MTGRIVALVCVTFLAGAATGLIPGPGADSPPWQAQLSQARTATSDCGGTAWVEVKTGGQWEVLGTCKEAK